MQKIGYTESMQANDTYTITINKRGGLTLPAKLREKAGVNPDELVVAEITESGILLRPAAVVPIEMWSDERIAEFRSDEKELGKVLDELGIARHDDFPG